MSTLTNVEGITNDLRAPYPLRPYQAQSVAYLYDGQRRFLTHAPRLGKTACAILAAEPPVLIAAPAYLTAFWYDELMSFGGHAEQVILAQGNARERQEALLRVHATDGRTDHWHIVNIEMLREYNDGSRFANYVFGHYNTFIVDEAHHLRGRRSLQNKGAQTRAIASGRNGWRAAKRVYLLTGTPVQNKPDDLFGMLRLLDPQRFSSYWQFINTYCKVVDLGDGFGPRVVGTRDPNFYKPLQAVFAKYAYGLSKEQAGIPVATTTEQIIRVDGDERFYKTYNRMKREYEDDSGHVADSLMEVLLKLRAMTVPTKLAALAQLVDDSCPDGVLVFCKYKDTARAAAALLRATLITGEDAPMERRAKLANTRRAVATLDSMSEGVDASHIPTTVFLEGDYTPGTMTQATERNALSPVPRHVYYLLVRKTVDEVIHRAHTGRGMTAQQILHASLHE